jgi:phosphohistidine phosphatase
MKTLFLVRHAKSSWDDRDLTDFERPLNERGLNDAPIIAKILHDRKIKPDLIISSPAVRALSTAQIFAKEFHYDFKNILEDERIYEAAMRDLTEVVREIPNDIACAMLFGHNPGISNFVNLLGDQFIADMPTCAIAGLELKINSWAELERRCGNVVLFEYPKKLKK